MFHQRSPSLGTDVAALGLRVKAIESEIDRLSRKTGQRASAAASSLADHVANALLPELNKLGSNAASAGSKFGNDALRRFAAELEYRPLTLVAVALGLGVLIGVASAKSRQ